jgi:hypothetical protein
VLPRHAQQPLLLLLLLLALCSQGLVTTKVL